MKQLTILAVIVISKMNFRLLKDSPDPYDPIGTECLKLASKDWKKSLDNLKSLGQPEHALSFITQQAVFSQATGYPFTWIEKNQTVLPENAKILDIGSGLGIDDALLYNLYTQLWRKESTLTIDGLDSSTTSVKCSGRINDTYQHNPNLNPFINDIETQVFKNNQDYIFTNGGMCLLEDKALALRNIQASLKTGGFMELVISVLLQPLPAEYDWPYCIAKFTLLSEIHAAVDAAGFTGVQLWDIGDEGDDEPMAMPMKNKVTGATDKVDVSKQVAFQRIVAKADKTSSQIIE